MATYAGNYEYIDEGFVGGSGDDLFILGAGNEVVLGGDGSDVAQLPNSLREYSSAVLFPGEGIVALTIEGENAWDDDDIYFLEGIEELEFSDVTIDLLNLVESRNIDPDYPDELKSYSELELGKYEYISETFDNNGSVLFAPGLGDANIIASDGSYSTVVIPGDIEYDITFSGSRATILLQAKNSYEDPSRYVIRDAEVIFGLNSGYWYKNEDNEWYSEDVYDLKTGNYLYGNSVYGRPTPAGPRANIFNLPRSSVGSNSLSNDV